MSKKCSFCGNKIGWHDNRVNFKDGYMCQDCATKYHLADKYGMVKIEDANYCKSHTIEEFENSEKYANGVKQARIDDQQAKIEQEKEDKAYFATKPKNLTRRLIAVILFLVAAAILIIQSLGVFSAYSIAFADFGAMTGIFGLLLAAAMIVHGIYYIKTRCAYKNGTLEDAWLWVYLILAFIIFGSGAYKRFSDLGNVWPIVVIVLWALGYRWGDDQTDLIDHAKEQASKPVQVQVNQPQPSAKPQSLDQKADEIKKYKDLLDQNAISKAEYDEIKAKILNGKK